MALHWESVPAFREEFAHLAISPARFEFAGRRLTGSGGAAGIDMMLQWIESDYGPALANAVGRQLVHQRVSEEDALQGQSQHRLDRLPRTVVRALAIMETHLGQALANGRFFFRTKVSFCQTAQQLSLLRVQRREPLVNIRELAGQIVQLDLGFEFRTLGRDLGQTLSDRRLLLGRQISFL